MAKPVYEQLSIAVNSIYRKTGKQPEDIYLPAQLFAQLQKEIYFSTPYYVTNGYTVLTVQGPKGRVYIHEKRK